MKEHGDFLKEFMTFEIIIIERIYKNVRILCIFKKIINSINFYYFMVKYMLSYSIIRLNNLSKI